MFSLQSFHSELLWIPITPLSDFLVCLLFVPYILVFQMNTLFYAVLRSFSNGFIYILTPSPLLSARLHAPLYYGNCVICSFFMSPMVPCSWLNTWFVCNKYMLKWIELMFRDFHPRRQTCTAKASLWRGKKNQLLLHHGSPEFFHSCSTSFCWPHPLHHSLHLA